MLVMVELGKLELSSSQKSVVVFGSAFLVAGIVISTLVFPFWNLIREDQYEEVVILNNYDGVCYVDTGDNIPKIIEDCALDVGDSVMIKFGKDLAWATVVEP